MTRRSIAAAGAVALLFGGGIAIWRARQSARVAPLNADSFTARLTFVGSQACASCHAAEAASWRSSQHAAAMSEVSSAAVLGRFDGTTFSHGGVTSTFFQRDGKFFVRTDGPDGRTDDFQVRYTFGVWPLQQYLIPMAAGRLQALSLAWDARARSDGGQRWFHLYPTETVRAGDTLHWTGIQQNWNFMCADCHATNVRKGYDEATRTFHTTWSELSVGCEACHGPGSAHVAASRAASSMAYVALPARLDERRGVTWQLDASTGRPMRSERRSTDREIEVCARCHSRRWQITDRTHAGDSLHDAFRVDLLDAGLFHADGQQQGEVYTYASFLQSRMYAAGVTCSDCHEPHSGRLRADGNALCTRCHTASRYDAPDHHFHKVNTKAAACVACHMPSSTFMVIDDRRDHSFRVPMPALTASIGTPNACTTSCHTRQDARWAERQIEQRTGRAPGGFQTFAPAFAAAETGAPGAFELLVGIASDAAQPAIVRASAIDRLDSIDGVGSASLPRWLVDANPLVRRTAVNAARGLDPTSRRTLVAPLLIDAARVVRTAAALALIDADAGSLSSSQLTNLERAFAEFVDEQRYNADRPEAQTNLGHAWMTRGDLTAARSALQEALRIDPTFVAAYVDLAEVYRLQNDEAVAERALRQAITLNNRFAAAHHALGLALVRQHRVQEALPEFDQALKLEPNDRRYAYVYGVALHDSGDRTRALLVLETAARRHTDDVDILSALVTYCDEAGRSADAQRYRDRLAQRQRER